MEFYAVPPIVDWTPDGTYDRVSRFLWGDKTPTLDFGCFSIITFCCLEGLAELGWALVVF